VGEEQALESLSVELLLSDEQIERAGKRQGGGVKEGREKRYSLLSAVVVCLILIDQSLRRDEISSPAQGREDTLAMSSVG
jgi:hypothetical protein